MISKKYLFLHYGPGGNAQVEKTWLSSQYPNIIFWDCPTKESEASFEKIIQDYSDQLKKLSDSQPISLIGHSFGCDVALHLAQQFPDNISEVHLVSPIRSIPKAFTNLGKTLHQLQPAEALNEANKVLIDALSKNEENLSPVFWKLVEQIVAHKDFLNCYWQDSKAFSQFQEIAQNSAPLNFNIWQSILNDYINVKNTPYDASLDKIANVTLGENDPYYDFNEELSFWKNKINDKQLILIEKSGHYPHLEKNSLELLNL